MAYVVYRLCVCTARQAVDTSSMHRGVVEKTAQMEKSKFVEPSYDIGDYCKSKPVFIEPLKVSAAPSAVRWG